MGILLFGAIFALLGVSRAAAEVAALWSVCRPATMVAVRWERMTPGQRRRAAKSAARAARLAAAQARAEKLAAKAEAQKASAKAALKTVAREQSRVAVANSPRRAPRVKSPKTVEGQIARGAYKPLSLAFAQAALAKAKAVWKTLVEGGGYAALDAKAQRAAKRALYNARKAARKAHDRRRLGRGVIVVGGTTPTQPARAMVLPANPTQPASAAARHARQGKAAAAKAAALTSSREAWGEVQRAIGRVAIPTQPTRAARPVIKSTYSVSPLGEARDRALKILASGVSGEALAALEASRREAETARRLASCFARRERERQLASKTPTQPATTTAAQGRPLGIIEKGAIPALRRKAPAAPARKGTPVTGKVTV